MHEILRMSITLAVICCISAGTLSGLKHHLDPQITAQEDLNIRGPALEKLFQQPPDALLKNKTFIEDGDRSVPVFYLKDNENISGIAMEVTGAGGYGGDVVIMLGIDPLNANFTGMEIIQHQETPGVGSRIEEDGFRSQWHNVPLSEPVKLVSDGGPIDGISGATYSTRAVLNGTDQARTLFEKYHESLITKILSPDQQNPAE